jgi:hypothetical protein
VSLVAWTIVRNRWTELVMSREEHAREGAQVAVPDDEIVDVAVVMP